MSRGFNLSKDLKGLVKSYLVQEDVSIAKGQKHKKYGNYAAKNALETKSILSYNPFYGPFGGCDTLVYAYAAYAGHLDVLKYLYENGYPWDENVCAEAARGRNLECLKYLHENGFPWDSRVFGVAAKEGRLDVLKYLHVNGYPWDVLTTSAATYRKHSDILKYLRKNKCPT